MIRLVIFDLDGTLLNSIADLKNACNVALEQLGYPLHDEATYKTYVGNGIFKLVERSLPEGARDEENICRVKSVFDAYYRAHSLDETKPYPGMVALLEYLQNKGIACGVVTNKAHDYAAHLVDQFFGKGIQLTLGQREGIPAKPNPQGVKEMMAYFKAEPEECLYVGDSNVDMETARAAGVPSIGVLWGFREEAELRAAGADYLVEDTAALQRLIIEKAGL